MTAGLRIVGFSAGYPKRRVIDQLEVPCLPRVKSACFWGPTAAANPRCCDRWPV